MTSEQEAAILMVGNDIRMAVDALREPYLATLQGIPEARERLLNAQRVIDNILLEQGRPPAKKEVVDRIIRDIAREDAHR
ncbi:MAG: hypothetical protein ABSG25_11110 [Bryobacteraceae bacterium]